MQKGNPIYPVLKVLYAQFEPGDANLYAINEIDGVYGSF
jgi:hypothetical protein